MNVDIVVVGNPPGVMDMGIGGVNRQVRAKVCIAVSNSLTVLQGKLVRVQNLDQPLNSGVVVAELIEEFQILMIRTNTGGDRK